jgi:pyruvate,water dikinase
MAKKASAGKSVVVVDVEKQERQQFALNDHELQELAKQALIIENHGFSNGHRVGKRW